MAVQLTYTGTPFADQIRQQGFTAGKPTGGFGLRFADLFQRGPKTFTTPNLGVASLYGKTIPVASSTANLRLPSGAIPGKTFLESLRNIGGTKFGTEVIQTPEQATKGMKLAQTAERLKNVSPTAARLLSGQTVSGFGGAAAPGFLRTAARTVFGPLTTATLGPQLIAAGMTPRTQAGFDFMKGFDEGAITSIADETAGLDFQDFGKGIMAADAAATQKAALENALIDATPIFASEDIAARNVGVPQDNRFTGIMRNIARGPLFSGGVQAGLTAGELLTGAANIPLALAGGIASQFLPLGRSKPDMDYQYVNNPNNMGGLRVVDNKIVDPSGILSGKNFESAFGSKNLGEMYDKEIGRLDNFITDLEEEEELTDRQKARLDRLTEKRQIARNRLQDYLMSTETIPGTNMTRGQFARDYNLGIGQFAMPTTDVTGKTLDYTGESDTYAGGESTPGDDTSYSDPYDPGGGE